MKSKKILFLLFFVLSFLIIYIVLSYFSLSLISESNKFSDIKSKILKTESFIAFDRKLDMRTELKKNLKSENLAVFSIDCEPLYVGDLSLGAESCFDKNGGYSWKEVNSPQKTYLISFNKKQLLNDFWNDYADLILVTSIVYFMLTTVFVFTVFYLFVDTPMRKISLLIKRIANGDTNLNEDSLSKNVIVTDLYTSIFRLVKTFSTYEKEKALLQLSRQVAHDIRSPLEVLRSTLAGMDISDFDSKEMMSKSVARIHQIANSLLQETSSRRSDLSMINIGSFIDEIYSEKMIELTENQVLVIKKNISNAFVMIDDTNLYRSISNIINNAFDSYTDKSGRVEIILTESASWLEIQVKDYGYGIPAPILEKIREGGFTTKRDGNGIGLSSAISFVEQAGGNLIIESEIGKGTLITIKLPSVSKPDWFEENLYVNIDMNQVIVDDDISFHELYRRKLANITSTAIFLKPEHIEQVPIKKNCQYFIDYDLGLEGTTGLEFITRNNLERSSTLVTSMFQDEKIQNECKRLGIKILPKQIFHEAQVIIGKKREIVLIDNDRLIHFMWVKEAKGKSIPLKTFFSVDEFITASNEVSKDALIYIDSDLGEGIKGEIDSERIAKLGFTELYLATGYPEGSIILPKWIKGMVDKAPKF